MSEDIEALGALTGDPDAGIPSSFRQRDDGLAMLGAPAADSKFTLLGSHTGDNKPQGPPIQRVPTSIYPLVSRSG